jgi:murein L,D-transpeptidase YcbB/YkuD
MIEQAGNLFNKIKNIGDEGIDLTRLPYQKVMNSLMENHAINTTDSMALATELMLTSQYLLYARNVWNGLAEQSSIDQEWLLPRKKLLYTQLLDSLLTGKDLLENAPVYKQYYLLKQFLQAYRQAEPGDTLLINASANKYALGDSGSTIGQIKNKLVLLGDSILPC